MISLYPADLAGREYRQDLLEHDDRIVYVHELSGVNALREAHPDLAMAFRVERLELGPREELLLGNGRLGRPSHLHSWKPMTFDAVILEVGFLFTVPLRQVGQYTKQEATCKKLAR